MLRTSGRKIVDAKGREVILRSIGIGGWLMMEGYMLGGHNIPEHVFKRTIGQRYGAKGLKDFEKNFRASFFNENDVKTIKKLGFNCARLPINYRVLDDTAFLNRIIGWFRRHKVYVILDLHAAPGSQNYDWHSDSNGKARLWGNRKNVEATVKIWDRLSKRYRNEQYIAGYDILNEPVTDDPENVNGLYLRIIDVIRGNNDRHILFIEPNMWAQDFKGIRKPADDNFAWSVHFYLPLLYTFNWNPMLKHPGRPYLKKELMSFKKIQSRDNVPIFVGEFGVASRCPACNAELKWVKDALSVFREFKWSWSYWTYKSTAGALVPDGLYRTFDHEVFHRETNEPGMENIIKLLAYDPKRIYRALKTENFSLHKELYRILARYL